MLEGLRADWSGWGVTVDASGALANLYGTWARFEPAGEFPLRSVSSALDELRNPDLAGGGVVRPLPAIGVDSAPAAGAPAEASAEAPVVDAPADAPVSAPPDAPVASSEPVSPADMPAPERQVIAVTGVARSLTVTSVWNDGTVQTHLVPAYRFTGTWATGEMDEPWEASMIALHPDAIARRPPSTATFPSVRRTQSCKDEAVAVIDVAGFMADLKDHAVGHGFHVHDERHFLETYSLRQNWEVDLHPEEGCGGPVDLHLALEIDPRTLLAFEDAVIDLGPEDAPPPGFEFPLTFTWVLPPLEHGPDLLLLATELAGLGGADFPLDVSAIDSFPSATDAPQRSVTVVARQDVSLSHIVEGEEMLCAAFESCLAVSRFLLDRAPSWL